MTALQSALCTTGQEAHQHHEGYTELELREGNRASG